MKTAPGPREAAAGHSEHSFPPFPRRAYLTMMAATFLWSSNVVAVKFAVQELPQVTVAVLRVTLSAVTLALLHLLCGGSLRLGKGERWSFLKFSLFGLSLSFLFFTVGVSYTSVSHTVFVAALGPLVVLLFARWEGQERITPVKVAGLLLSLAGVLLLVLDKTGGSGPSWQGDLLVMAGICCFSFFTVRSKKFAAAYPTLQFTTLAFLAAAVWFLPLLLWELTRLPWSEITWVGWSGLLYSATFGSAGAYLTYYYSLRLISASRAAAFHYLQPVLGAVLGVLFFQDMLTAKFGTGAALILAGIFVARRR